MPELPLLVRVQRVLPQRKCQARERAASSFIFFESGLSLAEFLPGGKKASVSGGEKKKTRSINKSRALHPSRALPPPRVSSSPLRSKMFESYLADLLVPTLGHFLDISPESLRVSLFSGRSLIPPSPPTDVERPHAS